MKNNIRVLVVDNNESTIKDIEKYFSSHEVVNVVACKKDGEEALEYILNYPSNIDVIIMDLILPKIDGLFILSEMERREINKGIIITTNLKDDNIMDEANLYGVDYYMLKPVNYMSLEKRIINVSQKTRNSKMYIEEKTISDLLHRLGIPSHIRGYRYIKEGIMIVYKNGNNISYITKDVYPEVAKKFSTTPTRVERAIRHAIEISWNRGDINLMEEIFGNSLDINRDKPTNSEYLTTIADLIKLNHNIVYS